MPRITPPLPVGTYVWGGCGLDRKVDRRGSIHTACGEGEGEGQGQGEVAYTYLR